MTRRKSVILQLAASLVAGALISRAKLAHQCRDRTSEACVWGRAFDVVSFPLETIVFGLGVFIVLLVGLHFIAVRRR